MVYVYIHVYREASRLSSGSGSQNQYGEDSNQQRESRCDQYDFTHKISQFSFVHITFRVAVTLGFVMGIFVLCWLPFFIWMPVTSLAELHTPEVVYNVILWVGYGNSAVNPFIYGLFCKEFRAVISSRFRQMSFSQPSAI